MTGPQQPTVADAVRMMDSLSTKSISSSPIGRHSYTTTRLTASEVLAKDCDASEARYSVSIHDDNQPTLRRLKDPYARSQMPQNTAMDQSKSRFAGDSTRVFKAAQVPSLPAEIVFQIATHLLPNPHRRPETDSRPGVFPCSHSAVLDACSSYPTSSLHSLLSMASVSRSYRNTLVPLIWNTIIIRTPQHLPRLASLFKKYDTLSIRSTSPSATRRASSPPLLPSPSYEQSASLRHPLPHIRRIIVSVPDKYMDLDQTFLLTLLRSMHLSRTQQLEHLSWSAEAVPNPAIWPLLAPSLRSLEVDCRTFYQGHKGWGELGKLESLKMVGYESTLLPLGVVSVFQAQSQTLGELKEDEGEELSEVPAEASEETHEMRVRSDSPMVELQTYASSPPRRQAQHLYLDPPPTTTTTICPSIEVGDRGRLLSTPLPTGSVPTRSRLKHLSLSTSKTSLLHQPSLLLTSSFSDLTCLDIYPVTPTPPLSSTLLSTASTLTHLRLVLDISGAFANFDQLWSDLTGRMPALEWLEIDPMPQQNTAPSFWSFVEKCERLEWINGRKVASFPPCFGGFDPGTPSGALPF